MASVNVAASANGGTATAVSYYSANFLPDNANNGDRTGVLWGGAGGGWSNDTQGAYPTWLQIDFDQAYTINEIDVITLRDNFASGIEPTLSDTFTSYGIVDFQVQYWNGSAWTTVTGGTVTGNNKVWRKFTFTAISVTQIRVLITASIDGFSRLVEVEAWTAVATDYTLTADSGSFTLSGQSANLLRSRSIAAATGVFSLTGQVAGLNRSRSVTAGTGVFSLTGVAAGLAFSRKVSAGIGTFTLTGNAANLLRSRTMAAGVGAFTLSGIAANLVYTPAGSYSMPAGIGAFVLTGRAANLLASRKVTAGTGAFTFTGNAAAFAYSKAMPAGTGAFTFTGRPVNFLYSRVLHVNAGAFVLSGLPVNLTWSNAPVIVPKVDPRYLARAERRVWSAKA